MKASRALMTVNFCLTLGLTLTLAQAPSGTPAPAEIKSVVEKAVGFLRTHQDADGSFSKKLGGPGVTGLVVVALLRHGYGPDDPMVAKALKYLESSVKEDGGIYDRVLANYTTSVCLLALKEANNDRRYDTAIRNAANFLKSLQHDEAHQVPPGQPEYGGAGYDGKSRPDLSNTHFFVEALVAAGVSKDDPAMRRALVFISRCQNLPGEHNDQPFAKVASEEDKGGFIYTPVKGGQSNAGKSAEGGLRSSGVMTYAGLKSFLHAGVEKNDPRVQSAVKWMRANYTLDANPGQGQAGLFYYYHVFAKALHALGEGDQFQDAKGIKRNWKRDLFEALKSRQREDGSWTNAADRFYEGDGNLCVAYALLALSYCQPEKR